MIIDHDAISTISEKDRRRIFGDPTLFGLFFFGEMDHWYQEPIIKDNHEDIVVVLGRQCGKSSIISKRCVYNAITMPEFGILIFAPSERQSKHLYDYAINYLERNPILYDAIVDKPKVSGTKFRNGSEFGFFPVGQTGDTARGFPLSEVIFEEAAFIPDKVFEALMPSLLSTAGSSILLGTPFGKLNHFYRCFSSAFITHTIPEAKWRSFDIYPKDMIIKKNEEIDPDDGYSAHHYPSAVGLHTFQKIKVVVKEEWEIISAQRKYRGWRVILDEEKRYIGRLLLSRLEAEEQKIHESGEELTLWVGFPQVDIRRLKKEMKKGKNYFEREYLALFDEIEGAAFPSSLVDSAVQYYDFISCAQSSDIEYYGGIDIAAGVGRDYSVITIVEYREPKVKVVYIWYDNKRSIKEVSRMMKSLHTLFNIRRWFVDKNSIGTQYVQEMQFEGYPVDGIGFSISDKMAMYGNLERLFEHNLITIPNFEPLILQLKGLVKDVTVDKKIKYHHQPGNPDELLYHDDFPDSLALACLCALPTSAGAEYDDIIVYKAIRRKRKSNYQLTSEALGFKRNFRRKRYF